MGVAEKGQHCLGDRKCADDVGLEHPPERVDSGRARRSVPVVDDGRVVDQDIELAFPCGNRRRC
jgi:hypothetical protein